MAFTIPRNEALTIRRAGAADAASIARVQVQSWREAYAGIIPRAYLDGLSANAQERQWRRTLTESSCAFVALWEREIVGFASGGTSRVRRDISGELYLLYVLKSHQRRGIGRALFDVCHFDLARSGHYGLLVWVLADNPARRFYERLGGGLAHESHVTIGGARLRELAYVWPD